MELIKDENSEVKLNVIDGFRDISNVIEQDLIQNSFLTTISNLTKDGQWRVRMAVFELIADLAILLGE